MKTGSEESSEERHEILVTCKSRVWPGTVGSLPSLEYITTLDIWPVAAHVPTSPCNIDGELRGSEDCTDHPLVDSQVSWWAVVGVDGMLHCSQSTLACCCLQSMLLWPKEQIVKD